MSLELVVFGALCCFAFGIMAGVWASGKVDAMQNDIDESHGSIVLPEDFQK